MTTIIDWYDVNTGGSAALERALVGLRNELVRLTALVARQGQQIETLAGRVAKLEDATQQLAYVVSEELVVRLACETPQACTAGEVRDGQPV